MSSDKDKDKWIPPEIDLSFIHTPHFMEEVRKSIERENEEFRKDAERKKPTPEQMNRKFNI